MTWDPETIGWLAGGAGAVLAGVGHGIGQMVHGIRRVRMPIPDERIDQIQISINHIHGLLRSEFGHVDRDPITGAELIVPGKTAVRLAALEEEIKSLPCNGKNGKCKLEKLPC